MPSFFAPSISVCKRCSAGLRLMSVNRVSTLTWAERSSAPRNAFIATTNSQMFLVSLFMNLQLLERLPDPLRRERQFFDPRTGTPRHRVGHCGRDRYNSALAQTFSAIRSRAVRIFDQDRFELVGYVVKSGHLVIDQARIDDLPAFPVVRLIKRVTKAHHR